MAAAYRVVVSSVSCYSSVVVDRRAQSHAVHYCSGVYGVVGEDSPPWRGKKNNTTTSSSPDRPLQSSASLKDITGEAINLASGKLKEFSFEKLRLSTSHVTFRKGRKVRPDSYSRRSTDLDIVYGHFTGNVGGTGNGTITGNGNANDENLPPFSDTPKVLKGLSPASITAGGGSLSSTSLSSVSRGGSTGSLSSACSGSLEAGLNTVASLYLSSLADESLIARLLEKTRAGEEGGVGGAGGEDIRACLDILVKCSEDLKKCTDIIKQCISRKSPGGGEDGGASPESIYRAVMTRLSSYLKKLPLELEGAGLGLGSGAGGQGSGIGGHSELAELVSSLHMLQQAAVPFSPIFGNDQPPRYEDIVQNPPLPKSKAILASSSIAPDSSLSLSTTPETAGRHKTQTQINPQAQRPVPVRHLTANAQATRSTPSSPAPLPKAEGSVVGLGDEEDGALLLRILESIESFAQELVDSGGSPGNTGKTGAQSKEKEVMRLLQDNLATAAKTDTMTQTQAKLPLSPPAGQDGPVSTSVHVAASTPAPRPTAGAVPVALPVSTAPTPVPVPVPKPVPAHIPTTLAESSALPTPVPPPTVVQSTVGLLEATTLERTPVEGPTAELTAGLTTKATPPPSVTPLPSPVPPPTPTPAEAPVATIAAPVAVRHPVAPSDAVALRDIGSTLLIQQTPEVIRVQSNKQDKKPGTPPPAPLSPTPSIPPPHHSPSPPPTPVVLTPPPPPPSPPPALNIPRFYYPRGLPGATKVNHDAAITAIETAFTEFEEEKADIYEMGKIAKACGCPLYWKAPMFNGAGGERTGFVSVHSFIATWRKLLHSCYDDSSKFIYLLAKPGCTYLDQEDFIPLLQDIVDTHPGLTFLKDAPEFHSRYITTVIQRIFYVVNRSWTGRITMTELRRSNFLQTLALLEEEDDINQITDYFSYEHFYVIYCKFWELDTDHDLYIDPKDLARYNDHASSSRIIERLFSGAVTRGSSVQREGRMSYAEFTWFLISEEDKKNPTSIEYWFRCMDTDGDGVLSMFELEYFYEEQCSRMEGMGIEPLPFTDLLCQMLDLVKPESQGKITLSDLKRCRMAHIFFDTFFNLEKYLDHEQRDPFALQKDIDNECPEPSDWDKYASEEYEILVAEETANEQLQEGTFDDDYEEAELPVQGEMIGNKMDKLLISDLTA
ncbi:hypothetical protein J4Q44_G00047120 [Coregonus suidteri]|uniref:EF-hand domain-containing protein n=1 Tax=Coregonus suidteri TaxID=861788 RepID=A0AAN8R1X4_9TELE